MISEEANAALDAVYTAKIPEALAEIYAAWAATYNGASERKVPGFAAMPWLSLTHWSKPSCSKFSEPAIICGT
jgi:hypothetical protein